MMPYAQPYLETARRVGPRDLQEIVQYSAKPVSYLAAPAANWTAFWVSDTFGGTELLLYPGIVATALALWKIKLIVSLLFLAFVIAAAMRPGVDWLHRHRVPRGFGVALHYLALLAVVALFLWLVVPRAIDQVQAAIGNAPQTRAQIHREAVTSTGLKHQILTGLDRRLRHLPSAGKLFHPALTITVKAFEVLIGIFFTFAAAAYWIFERDRAESLVLSLVSRQKRRVIRDTWNLIDLKLGAFVRGQLLLIVFVGVVLSLAFWAVGEPYFILLGAFAGVVEMVPVIGPLAAGAIAVGVGLTQSLTVAVAAALCVLGVRLLEDYVVVPRVLGEAVGLSPLVVLVSVTAVGILFGGFAVLLAVPLAAVLATLVDVIVLNKDPAKEEVPTVLFPAKDAEG
jgi:predicted PurR-regulated permease PerM